MFSAYVTEQYSRSQAGSSVASIDFIRCDVFLCKFLTYFAMLYLYFFFLQNCNPLEMSAVFSLMLLFHIWQATNVN